MSVLLRDLLAADSMAYHHAHVVLVVPQEPTLAWEALLCLQPSYAVTYLNGDLRCACPPLFPLELQRHWNGFTSVG